MSFGLLLRRFDWSFPLAGAALLAIAVVAARDVGPQAAAARAAAAQQSLYFSDDFHNRDRWYADAYSGQELFPLQRTYSTAGATLEPGESAPCAPGISATNWIEYHTDRSGTLHLSAAGDTFDAFVAVYTWDMAGDFIPSPPGAKLQPVVCAAEGTPNQALSFAITANTQYIIQIGGRDGGSGNIAVNAACDCTPPNDDLNFQGEIYVSPYEPETTRRGSTANATLQAGEPRPCGNVGATVWYSLYADNPTAISLDTTGSDFDTVVALYRFPLDHLYDGQPDPAALQLVACEDDGPSPAALTVATEQYRQYFVQVGGAAGATGRLQLTARCEPTCPPYNDSVANAEWWEPPSEFCCISTAGATIEDGEPRPCGTIGATVWYRIIARGDATLVVDSAQSDYDTVLAMYASSGDGFIDSPPGSLDLMTCRASSSAGRARLEFDAKSNVSYWLQAGGRGGATGQLGFSLNCTPLPCPPFHDTIQNPWGFDKPYGEPYEEIFDVRGATVERGEPLGCGDMGHTTWWVYEGYEGRPTVPFVFDAANSTMDTSIAVYEAPVGVYSPDGYFAAAFDDLREIACEPGAGGADARVVFSASAGHRYYVQVGGRDGASGELHVTISCDGGCPPDNDNQAQAWTAPIGYQQFTDTRAATTEPGESLPCGNMGKTIWYHLPAPVPGEFIVSTAGSDFATAIAVYAFKGFSPPGGFDYVGCASGEALTFRTDEGISYYIQIGGRDGASGALQTRVDCIVGCAPTSPPGGIAYGAGGAVGGPDTGSGGYLPGAGRD